ncbi:lytic transglycosylase domain-containing protein [Salmonella enterica subsp. enterica serovar Poona]|nr:lytic transglycosylase [Salmonella enterica subsp. enterica serovar Muenchen]ECQ3651779.1 lytic transglycosylase domain-containing protein [Salmonella enterica]EDV4825285.1 lytic transglycosylase domain-containing protein [Salmonella enterica]EKS5644401.1 lytic transglycosylase domain-containing protein [Salmonella enterica]EKS5828634.1 lytic transglycosylase domain-containing protein [Salmonella enterica]
MHHLVPLYFCLIQASYANHVPAEIVTSVISVEGGRHGMSAVNANKTEDLGIMQINTGAWLRLVSDTFFTGDESVAYNALKNDDCFNIEVGTWILAYSIHLENGDLWNGVGRYHSNTQRYKEEYIAKVKGRYQKLFGATAFMDVKR